MNIAMHTITIRWRKFGNVKCIYNSRGWEFDFREVRAAKNDAGQYLIPPHSTDDEVDMEFQNDLNSTAIGQYMANLVDGSGTI